MNTEIRDTAMREIAREFVQANMAKLPMVIAVITGTRDQAKLFKRDVTKLLCAVPDFIIPAVRTSSSIRISGKHCNVYVTHRDDQRLFRGLTVDRLWVSDNAVGSEVSGMVCMHLTLLGKPIEYFTDD